MELIAEFCQNHNGDISILNDMVYQAKEAGCHYAKIQSISPEMLTFRERFENGVFASGKTLSIKRPYEDEIRRLGGLELTIDEQADFVELCKKVGIKPLTTAFTRGSIPSLLDIGFKEIKIASYDCASLPLLRDSRENFERIIVSTGATYNNEVESAAKLLDGSNYSFLHCVTLYPTPLSEFHLARMNYLRRFTKSVGWSDHSLYEKDGVKGALAAIYFGADIIERHFTVLSRSATKDGPVSIGPIDAKKIIEYSKLTKSELKNMMADEFPEFEITLGQADRDLSEAELLNRDYYRGRFASPIGNRLHKFNWIE
jgi:sialic acid synthase SpsE